MNKRGLSPIVATILLIAFAVAIGAMIITFFDGTGETSTCKELKEHHGTVLKQNSFCRLSDQVIPRVKTGEKEYEACEDMSITVSELPIC